MFFCQRIKIHLIISIILFQLHKLDAQNLVLNSTFDEYVISKDQNDKIVYSPDSWHYNTNTENRKHPIYYSTDRFLNKSIISNNYYHPDYRLIYQGSTDLNYISVPILPWPEKVYTELCDSLIPGQSYQLSLDIKSFDAFCFSDLIVGFSKISPDRSEALITRYIIPVEDTITFDYINNNWVSVCIDFEAQYHEKYMVIGAGNSEKYIEIINSNLEKFKPQNNRHPRLTYLIDNVYLTSIQPERTINIPIIIDSLSIGESFIFENIVFGFDQTEIREVSFAMLSQLAQYLVNNPNVKLMVIGHTDNIGGNTYNSELSLNRAKSVVCYLISAGVSSNRLQFDGLGSSLPIASNDTEIRRKKNRRVEIKIIDK